MSAGCGVRHRWVCLLQDVGALLMAFSSFDEKRASGAYIAPSRSACAEACAYEWIDRVARTPEEIERLCEETGAPWELARHALDVNELARVDHHPDGAILVVMRVPSAPDGADAELRTIALSVILMRDRVVTIAPAKLDVVTSVALARSRAVRSPAVTLIALVLAVADRFLDHLHAIEEAVSALETKLQSSLRNEELRGLLGHQKSLVHFRIGIASNLIMLERLAKDARVFSTPEQRELVDDAMVEMRQAAEMTTVSSDILGEMMDAFASIISNNLNVVMKIMTAVTIVIAVPSMVASFYGMNVALPGQYAPRAFEVLIALACAMALGMVILFRRARWI
jgi:magnesium transporter